MVNNRKALLSCLVVFANQVCWQHNVSATCNTPAARTKRAVSSISDKNFERQQVALASFTKNGGTLLSTVTHLRTKVECGGQCLTNPSCDAFSFIRDVCKLLRKELLYLDTTEQVEVYLVRPNAKEPASWTQWTSWESCRDDRLSSHSISATSTAHLCADVSNCCSYNRRRRTCQNHVNNGLKYSRFGGLNQCLQHAVSNEQDDINDRIPCPGLPSCPRIQDIRIYTGNEAMDNCDECCRYGHGGYCDHDLILNFQNKVGTQCQTRWLFNEARRRRDQYEEDGDDAFDDKYSWDYFNWNDVECVAGRGFYVPNKQFHDVWAEHRGTDGWRGDHFHIHWTDGTYTRCRRNYDNNLGFGFLDDSTRRHFTCNCCS